MEKLRQYIENQGLRQDKFAEKIGMSKSLLSAILKGQRTVSKKYWDKIIEATNGKISKKDLLNHVMEKYKD